MSAQSQALLVGGRRTPVGKYGGALSSVRPDDLAALTIKAVGDIIPGSDYQRYRLPESWQYLFGSIQYHLAEETDITFGNFESTLTEVPSSAKDTSRGNTFAFRTPPWYASVLKEAGFDVLNQHVQRTCGQLARLAHAVKIFRLVAFDMSIARRRGVEVQPGVSHVSSVRCLTLI